MKQLLALFFFLCCCLGTQAQSDTTTVAADSVEFKSVQIEASFPGGLTGWRTYLEHNLRSRLANRCITIPKGQHEAKQTVIVSFTVDVDGTVSDVIANNASSVCPLLAAEAVRVIKKGPKWVPARQDGRNVKYRQRQSITWVLTE